MANYKKDGRITHGKSNSPIYRHVWANMLRRCADPRTPGYTDYGNRSIKVCERWLSFGNFYADMGDPPFLGATIDRIDNAGDYCPENCRWASRAEQNRNMRSNRFVTYDGVSLCITDWAKRQGMKVATLYSRLCIYGWTVERALTHPVEPRRRKCK